MPLNLKKKLTGLIAFGCSFALSSVRPFVCPFVRHTLLLGLIFDEECMLEYRNLLHGFFMENCFYFLTDLKWRSFASF